jgi:hypothetical protein
VVCPECDEKIPDKQELDRAAGFIGLSVIPDLGWAFGKLIEKTDQLALSCF